MLYLKRRQPSVALEKRSRRLQQNHWCWSLKAALRQHQDIVSGSNRGAELNVGWCSSCAQCDHFHMWEIFSGRNLRLPVCEVVFVQVQESWCNVTGHPLENQRLWGHGLARPAASEVTLHIPLERNQKQLHVTTSDHWGAVFAHFLHAVASENDHFLSSHVILHEEHQLLGFIWTSLKMDKEIRR